MAAKVGRQPWLQLGEDRILGFVIRVILLSVSVLLIPRLVDAVGLEGELAYLVPGSVAALVALTYIWRPVEALLVLAGFVTFYDSIALGVSGPIKAADELAIALLLPLALARSWRSWRLWTWWPRELALTVVIGMALISTFVAGVPLTTWLPALVLVTKAIAFLYIVMWTRFREWEINAAMQIALAAGLIVALLGMIELLNPTAFRTFFGLNEYTRLRNETVVAKSLFTQPAIYGWFTAFVALFAFAGYLTTRRMRLLAAALFLSIGPFLSARRRAILALAGGLLAAFAESFRRIHDVRAFLRAWVPVAAGSLVLVLLFLPGLVGLYELTVERYVNSAWPSSAPTSGESPGPVAAESNPRARIALYVGSVRIATDDFPLGGGLGRYGSWMSRSDYSPLYEEYGLSTVPGLRPRNPSAATDTFWPQILGEMGALALVAYAGFLATLGYRLWREAARDDGPILTTLRLGAGMVFAQALVESLASSMFHSPPRVYLLYLAVGVVLSLSWRRRLVAAT